MKKTLAILAALVMVFAATVVMAEDSGKVTFAGNVQFNMDMDQVMKLVPITRYEIDNEKTRGSVEFAELEYENVTDAEGFTADIKYLFVGNSLVAIHYDMKDGTDYETVKAQLLAGSDRTAVPFDAAQIGNGKYAVDDDGDLKDCKEMIVDNGLTIVLEQDRDGDVDITLLDTTAAYINN